MSSYSFFELDSQYKLIQNSLEKRFKKITEHKLFINGPEVEELEDQLANYANVPFAFCTNNGTSSLIVSLLAIGIQPGDEVITAPVSFGATAMSIRLLGAVPVFLDIALDTGLIKTDSIEKAITKKTKAILPVSLYGQSCDMDPINDIAEKYNLTVIEDACQSFGGLYKGRKIGSLCPISAVSFFPSKPLGAYGSGGCVLTKNKDLADKVKKIRNQGQSQRFFYELIGLNAIMNTFQAVVLLEKFKLFEKELSLRREKADRYDRAFQECKNIKPIQLKNDRLSSRSYYILKSAKRDSILKKFESLGKPLTIHYPSPLFDQPAISAHCKIYGNPDSTRTFTSQVFSLPCHAYLKDKDQEDIIQLMRKVDAGFRN